MGSWSPRHLSSWTGIIASFRLVLLQGILICCILVFLLTRAGSHTASCSQISGTKLINWWSSNANPIPFNSSARLHTAWYSIHRHSPALPSDTTPPTASHKSCRAWGCQSHCTILRWNFHLSTRAKQMTCDVQVTQSFAEQKVFMFCKREWSVDGFLVCWSVLTYCIAWMMN